MDIFKERVSSEAPVEFTQAPTETKDVTNEDANTHDEIDDLSIWEGENKRKYGVDYFDIKNIAHEFPLKAHFGAIDKFIKEEIKEQGLTNDKKSYEQIIKDIEGKIGTTQTETYKRLSRLFEYIKTIKKYRDIKKKKEEFTKLYNPDY